jgi:hypothetical protein
MTENNGTAAAAPKKALCAYSRCCDWAKDGPFSHDAGAIEAGAACDATRGTP